jgi:hypothetical protein
MCDLRGQRWRSLKRVEVYSAVIKIYRVVATAKTVEIRSQLHT